MKKQEFRIWLTITKKEEKTLLVAEIVKNKSREKKLVKKK